MDNTAETTIREALRQVIDPEVGLNVVDLGLIYGVDESDAGVRVAMTMTTPSCPMGDYLRGEVEQAARAALPGTAVEVDLVWEPEWSPALMSEEAKKQFGWAEST